MSERFVGTVKWFNATKGYGFIGRDNGVESRGTAVCEVVRAGAARPQFCVTKIIADQDAG